MQGRTSPVEWFRGHGLEFCFFNPLSLPFRMLWGQNEAGAAEGSPSHQGIEGLYESHWGCGELFCVSRDRG